MKKKRYEGYIESLPHFKIYLNVNHLMSGKYELKIVHKNKVLKRTHFKKD